MPKNTYRLKDNTIVPGTTTICNQMGKGDGITNWAHRIAYDSTAKLIQERYDETGVFVIPKYENIQKWQGVRDSAGDIGILVHEAVLKFLSGEEVAISDDIVSNCFHKFLDWWNEEVARLGETEVIVEQRMVSEKWKFGGQQDIYAVTWKRRIDVKTGGKWVYPEWWIQLAGYDMLGLESGQRADEHQILWLPKDGRFDCPIRTELKKEKIIFKHLLGIYKARKTNSPPW